MNPLLKVSDLTVRFYTYEGVVKALEEVSLEVLPGEVFGLVGETGSGKTVTALSILVITPPPGKIEKGEVTFFGDRTLNLLEQRGEILRRIRGKEIAMVFQEPSSALNPVYTVGDQIEEVLLLHHHRELCLRAEEEIETKLAGAQGWLAPLTRLKGRLEIALYRHQARHSLLGRLVGKIPLANRRLRRRARRLAVELLREMEIADPDKVVDRYPHQLSGGMRQRVMIAMAMACHPKLLIADEPTTSVDVTIQAQILALLRRLKQELGSSILYITHNLGVVAELCDRVGVIYAGTMAEVAEVKELFRHPLHPYTQALLASIPQSQTPLRLIGGVVPSLLDPPTGCRFHPRCPSVMAVCSQEVPRLVEIRKGHKVACHLYPAPKG